MITQDWATGGRGPLPNDRRQARNGAAARSAPSVVRPPWPVIVFLVGLVIPWLIPLGPLTMPIYRLVLLVAVVPCIVMWLRGHAGWIRTADILFLLYAMWAGLCFVLAHGSSGTEPAGALFVETVGAYLLARCSVRDAATFRTVVIFMVKLLVVILPFAIVEWITGAKPILVAFGALFPTVEITQMTPRLGFWRVQGPFAHSIEFGVFCGSAFALGSLIAGVGLPAIRRLALAGLLGFTAALSMSSAPMAGVIFQSFLMGWNGLLRSFPLRWKLLIGIAIAGYLVIELGSNQTPVQFYISKFTFEQQTGWYRIWIWEYGSASVVNHPLFGIGLNDWARPRWMPADSVDNFWLLTAMRYGLPALGLFMLGMLCVAVPMVRLKPADERIDCYRLAYLICIGTFVFVGTTVHFWGALYVWFMFLLGCGACLTTMPVRNRRPQSGLADWRKAREGQIGQSDQSATQTRFQRGAESSSVDPIASDHMKPAR